MLAVERRPNIVFLILLYLAFLSGISPLHTLFPTIEHFPYGLLLVMMCSRQSIASVSLFVAIFVFYMVSFLYYGYSNFSFPVVANLVQMLNFISPLFFFRNHQEAIVKVARHVFWIYIAVGTLQIFHVMVLFEPVFDLLIARFQGAPIGGYRGVTMLETEPARAAFQLIMLYVIGTSLPTRNILIMTIALLVGIFIMNSSTTGFILMMVFSFFIVMQYFSPIRVILGFGIIGLAIFYFGSNHPKIAIIIAYYQADGIGGVYTALAAVSGGRFLGTMETIASIVRWPFGHGADPDFVFGEKVELDDFHVEGYRTRVSARPVSALLIYLYVFGVLMLVPFWYAVRRCVGRIEVGLRATALLIIGVIYSPPGTEAWLTAFLATVWASSRQPQPMILPSFLANRYFPAVRGSSQ